MTNTDAIYEEGLRLWREWTDMWNGQPELALRLAAPRFALHLPTPSLVDAATIDHPAAVERWVRNHISKFHHLRFVTGVGPFVDPIAGVVAGPWHADASLDGSPRIVHGMDTLRFRDGRILEYWTLSKQADAIGAWSTTIVR